MSRAWQGPDSQRQAVVCELTASGRGAICVLGVTHPNVVEPVSRFFQPANARSLTQQKKRRPIYGLWDREDVIVCLHDDSFIEVHCHGGDFAKRRIINDLCGRGFRHQPWNATDAGRLSAISARSAALLKLPETTTQKTAAVLTWQSEGVFDEALAEIDSLIESEEPQRAREKIGNLIRLGTLGLHLTEPWIVALAGPPNAGKSSLINRIAGYDRSIVFELPGTTRDLVTVDTAINGWPVRLVDTAGLRHSDDSIELAGITLAGQAIDQADLVLEVVDGSNRLTADPMPQLRDLPPGRKIRVLNKCDLVAAPFHESGVPVSALTGQGVEELLAMVSRTLVPWEPDPGTAVPFLRSQLEDLNHRLIRLESSH